uniref:TSP1_spondin domain-containing protein n=1 Tax=Macrostomum lignano TaxID=282301 RepID=A0A1I8GUT0_9PLAT
SQPVNCQLSAWSDWSTCPVTCGGSTRSRTREVAVKATVGGVDCVESDKVEMEACGTGDCGVQGRWAQWTDWTSCSVTCGGGFKKRERSCVSQNASRPMLPCPAGGSEMAVACHHFPCSPRREFGD